MSEQTAAAAAAPLPTTRSNLRSDPTTAYLKEKRGFGEIHDRFPFHKTQKKKVKVIIDHSDENHEKQEQEKETIVSVSPPTFMGRPHLVQVNHQGCNKSSFYFTLNSTPLVEELFEKLESIPDEGEKLEEKNVKEVEAGKQELNKESGQEQEETSSSSYSSEDEESSAESGEGEEEVEEKKNRKKRKVVQRRKTKKQNHSTAHKPRILTRKNFFDAILYFSRPFIEKYKEPKFIEQWKEIMKRDLPSTKEFSAFEQVWDEKEIADLPLHVSHIVNWK